MVFPIKIVEGHPHFPSRSSYITSATKFVEFFCSKLWDSMNLSRQSNNEPLFSESLAQFFLPGKSVEFPKKDKKKCDLPKSVQVFGCLCIFVFLRSIPLILWKRFRQWKINKKLSEYLSRSPEVEVHNLNM